MDEKVRGAQARPLAFRMSRHANPLRTYSFRSLLGLSQGCPATSWWLPRLLDVDPTQAPVNTQSAGKDRMERPLQVSQPPAGTHNESGPDTTPICPEMLSSLQPLTPAGFPPQKGLSEGLNEVQRLTGTTPESSNPESRSDEWGYASSISVLLALSGSIATQAGIPQSSRGWIE